MIGDNVVIVTDMNGVRIKEGDTVRVHQDDEKRIAKVVDIKDPMPTTKYPGWWVDIDGGQGVEGMMTYILEVLAEKEDEKGWE